jgi:hypothetical protein
MTVRRKRDASVLWAASALALALTLNPLSAFAACSWQRNAISDPLFSISAIGPNDIWTSGGGAASGTLLYHWDGLQWSPTQVSIPQVATSTTFVSAPADDDVWGVSSYVDGAGNVQPYAIHFDGTMWTQTLLQTELPDAPRAVPIQAFASNDVWAVGSVSDAAHHVKEIYAPEHWNGSGWSTGQFEIPMVRGQPTPNFEIDALEGVSSTDLWAVGKVTGYRPLIEHFDGVHWRTVPDQTLKAIVIQGVHAISSIDVWGVGYASDVTQHLRTFAAHWNGVAWAPVPTPNFDGRSGDSNVLQAVSGSGPNDVWAVGAVEDGQGNFSLLAEHWNGTSWSIVRRPTIMGSGLLNAVADLSPNDVWAVGVSGLGLTDFWCGL